MRHAIRPLRVWQTPLDRAMRLQLTTLLGFDVHGRWQWRCFNCATQCAYGHSSASAACDDAREHYTDEHQPIWTPEDLAERRDDAAWLMSIGPLEFPADGGRLAT